MAYTNLKGNPKNPFIKLAQGYGSPVSVVSPRSLAVGDICYITYKNKPYTIIVTETPLWGGPLHIATTGNLLLFAYKYTGDLDMIDFNKIYSKLKEGNENSDVRAIHDQIRYIRKGTRNCVFDPAKKTIAEDMSAADFRTFIVNDIKRCLRLER
jgi:hypothetical protein|tara:strand:- start:512 stop:973 length:462 start_codon:yes stop_codon:yes gene_type:complete